jgi:hypothetical protein
MTDVFYAPTLPGIDYHRNGTSVAGDRNAAALAPIRSAQSSRNYWQIDLLISARTESRTKFSASELSSHANAGTRTAVAKSFFAPITGQLNSLAQQSLA